MELCTRKRSPLALAVAMAMTGVIYSQVAVSQDEAQQTEAQPTEPATQETSQPVEESSTSADPLGLEEVVVYARKTDETEQTVPISMVTQTADQLENAQVVNFNDFADLTPGLDITSDDPTSTSIKMRGVGLDFFGLAADPGVVIQVDEFPQSRIGAVFGAFMDVEQIEVLKGPQGTLYGRNAPNGAINIWSKKPDHNGFHGYVDMDVSEYNTYQLETAFNIPVIQDMLAMRFARLQTESDGYADIAKYSLDNTSGQNIYTWNGDTEDADTRNGENNRLTILFEPVESFTMLAKLNHTDFEQGGISKIYDGPVVFDPVTVAGNPQPAGRVLNGAGNQVVADRSDFLMFQEAPDNYVYELQEAGVRTQWDNEYGSLISLSLYQEFETLLDEYGDDAAPAPYITPRTLTSFDRLISQELRWQADLNESVSYLAGVYYSYQTLYLTYVQNILGADLLVNGEQGTEVFGYFTSWDYQIDEQWSITAGVRYTEERERIDAFIDFGTLAGVLPPGLAIGDLEDQQRYYNTSYSFKTRYELNDQVMFYFGADTAYKSGGYNPPVAGMSTLGIVNPNFPLLEQELLLYPPEESFALELGVKATMLENRLRLNAAIFDQKFTDFQNFQGADPARISGFDLGEAFINAVDKVNTHGIEMDAFYLISENWSTRFGAAYAYPIIEEHDTNFCDQNEPPLADLYCPITDDTRLSPEDPLWSTNLSVQYTRFLNWKDAELVSNFTLITNGSSSSKNGFNQTIDYGEYSTANFNVGVNLESWRFKLWVTNLFDKEFYNNRELRAPGTTASLGVGQLYVGDMIKPRTFGFNVRYIFGEE